MTRHVVIGSGIAGFSAAQSLRSLDPRAEVVMVSEDPHGFYSRPGLAYYLTGEIPERQLFLFTKNGKIDLNIQQVKARVTAIDPASHSIEMERVGKISYDRLLLATGASSVPLDVPGTTLQGLVKLDNLEDTRLILARLRHTKTAVVVGGGVVGIELVEGLVARGIKVHYLLRGDWFWPNVLGEVESHMVERDLARHAVSLHHHAEIAEILGKNGKVVGVRTSAGQVLRCEMVAIGVGVRSRLELAKAAGLKTERGILVDEYLQTSAPDIYAAGDVAQIYDPLTQKSSIDNLWFPGRKQGSAAALNMTGHKQVYMRNIAVNVLRLAGLMTTVIGAVGTGRDEGPLITARGSSETWQQLPGTLATEHGTDVSHIRLVVSEQALLGALIIGDQKISKPLRDLIDARIDISPIRDELLKSGDSLGQYVMDFWIKTRKKTEKGSGKDREE